MAHEACITALEKCETEVFTVGFEAWAWGVLRIKIRNYFYRLAEEAKRTTGEPINEETLAGTAQEIDPDLERDLVRCLRKIAHINRRFARILNLTYQGYKTKDICEKLKVSRNSCHVTLHRGRALLKKCLRSGKV